MTEEKDPAGFKYRIQPELQLEDVRVAIERFGRGRRYRRSIRKINRYGEQVGMKFQGCHCLLDAEDPLAMAGGQPRFPQVRFFV